MTLNRTAFFPEGGGQQSDRGYIGDAYISDVQIKMVKYFTLPISR